MRIARSTSTHEVALEELADPVPGPGEVVCRVLACGVCGSDVSDGYVAKKLPVVLGHEVVGEVLATGDGVTAVAVGDRVIVHHHAPCGTCRTCRRGHETLCDQYRATRLDPGGFAEQVRVEAALVPELLALGDLDPLAGTFVEPLGCVLRALDRAGLAAGDELLVVGAGSNGLLAIAAARARGVEHVWIREPRARAPRARRGLGRDRAHRRAGRRRLPHHRQRRRDGRRRRGARARRHAVPVRDDEGRRRARRRRRAALRARADGLLELVGRAGRHARRLRPHRRAARSIRCTLVTHRLGLDETARALDLQRRGEAIKVVVVP